MGAGYIPILFLFTFAILLTLSFVILSALIGRPKNKTTDISPYECGVEQANSPRRPFQIRFFVIAIAFLLFDVEVALLFPWAAMYRTLVAEGMGGFVFIEGAVFIGVLAVGLVYIYRVGTFEEKKVQSSRFKV